MLCISKNNRISISYVQILQFMTILIRKYYNQPVAFDHRRIWLQKENQKRELREDLQNPNQGLRKNQSQNLKERKSPLEDTR